MAKVSVIVGTRPEIVKMASVVKALESGRHGLDWELVHTEQHYDERMSGIFFEELGLPKPHAALSVGSGTQASQTAAALARLGEHLAASRPDVVLVQGDTNTVLAGALAATKMGIRVGHVEAGLRSYDRRMPEETNRRLTDHASDYLYAPTEKSAGILRGERAWGEILVTGNTALDACALFADVAARRGTRVDVPFDRFALATAHRAENVDDDRVLAGFARAFAECPVPVVYPVHPRTRKRLAALGLEARLAASGNVHLVEPQGYLEFLDLMRRAEFVLTDSGGIQEEATAPAVRRKVFVLRTSTERPEAVDAGFAEVVGVDPDAVLAAVRRHVDAGSPAPDGPSPFGDARAGERIVAHLAERVGGRR